MTLYMAMGGKEQPTKVPDVIVKVVPKEVEVKTVPVLIARQDIPIGKVLDENDFDIKPWPEHLVIPGFISGPEGGVRKVARASFVKDEPILEGKLQNPNDPSFIAAALGPGMRAVTINIDLTGSVAGFIMPGDRVDVLFTFSLSSLGGQAGQAAAQGGGSSGNSGEVTEVMLPNVKILAVDQRVTGGVDPQGKQQGPAVPASVTLEVGQRDAQKLRLAEKMGKLSFVMRSLKDKDKFDIVRPTSSQDLSRILPPAYFPVLFDSDALYDFNIVDLYGNPELADAKNDVGTIAVDPVTGRLTKNFATPPTVTPPQDGNIKPTIITPPGAPRTEPGMIQKKTAIGTVDVIRGVQREKVEIMRP